jgi:single-strand DNA-binding protein
MDGGIKIVHRCPKRAEKRRKTMNKVMLVGRLVRDPRTVTLPSGLQVVEFSVAVNRKYKNRNGEWREVVDFIDIKCYGKVAERAKILRKGYQVTIEGRLKQEKWTTSNNERKSKITVVASKIKVLSKPKTATTSTKTEKVTF